MATKKAKKRSYSQIFLDSLREVSGGEQKLIGNKVLRDKLGWNEDRYGRVKQQLREENAIIVGRGQGGTVGLADAPGTPALTVFIAYSHADKKLKDELLKHMEPLRRLNLIEAWHDQEIRPGDEWEKKISEKLDTSDIILLLVSIDFIKSRYCYDVEMERAMELHASGAATVVPVLLRNCLWQHTPFSKLQVLPKGARPVAAWETCDDALTNVAEALKQIAENLRAAE